MTPSRNAHGHNSKLGRRRARASPARPRWRRPASGAPGPATPRPARRGRRGHPRDEADHLPQAVDLQAARHPLAGAGGRRAGQPRQRAERLAGGHHPVRTARRAAASSTGACKLTRPRARAAAPPRPWTAGRRRTTPGSAGRHPAAPTARPRGTSSSPAASSSEPPPMSRHSSRPALQPNQRRTARKVSRASSSPVSTAEVDTGSRPAPGPAPRRELCGVAHRRGREGQQLVAVRVPRPADGPRGWPRPGRPRLRGRGRRACRCVRRAAARSCATAAGSVARPGGRRPRAGGPCSSRRRAHRGAWLNASGLPGTGRRASGRHRTGGG